MQGSKQFHNPSFRVVLGILFVVCLIGEYFINSRYLHLGFGLIVLGVGGYLGYTVSAIATEFLFSFYRCQHGIIGGSGRRRCPACVEIMTRAAEEEKQRREKAAEETLQRHSRTRGFLRKDSAKPSGLTESPIEEQFWQCLQRELDSESMVLIVPQYSVGHYRLDFAIPTSKVAIELDGHEFHSSKRQRTYDAKRDRYLQEQGWRVYRFTGTEIYRDVQGCVEELADAAHLSMRSSMPPVSTQIKSADSTVKNIRLLLVARNAPWGAVFSKEVKDKRFELRHAGSLNDIIGELTQGSYDVILPVNDSATNAQELRRTISQVRGRFPYVGIVVLSGDAGPPLSIDCVESGADDVLQFPIESDYVIDIIRRVVLSKQIIKRNNVIVAEYCENVRQGLEIPSQLRQCLRDLLEREGKGDSGPANSETLAEWYMRLDLGEECARLEQNLTWIFKRARRDPSTRSWLLGTSTPNDVETPQQTQISAKRDRPHFSCPHCGHRYHFPKGMGGELIECVACQQNIRVPYKDGTHQIERSRQNVTVQREELTPSTSPSGEAKTKILLVDDESTLLEVLGGEFSSMGYDVDTALDGDIAVEKIRIEKFQVVILGIRMPRMDGIEVLKFIKQNYPGLKVIMLSGMSDERTVALARNYGADAFFAKPAQFEELLDQVERMTLI
jgi:DNA-binding response OmpR family regulator/very-short-patch-repair endonuclease/transcription elongation factor Elf1